MSQCYLHSVFVAIVEPDFSESHDVGPFEEFHQLYLLYKIEVVGKVRMDAVRSVDFDVALFVKVLDIAFDTMLKYFFKDNITLSCETFLYSP